ncbi:hypothetical protein CEXT_439981 [Caerostris extrusa]|uniref:Uncharacterized protein n=1 Tax=Caerostris extrusa TaxID=172846 RepID=A0AAV4N568_CAEEX|nr:hypothetical protein CEXT_439981 [Caerostris extrusa]
MRIEYRFRLACAYCFKDSIVSLWSVMSEDEKEMESDRLNASKWIPYLMEKDKTNWPKSSQDLVLENWLKSLFWNTTAIRNILQLIKPEERPVFLYKYLDYDDKYPHPQKSVCTSKLKNSIGLNFSKELCVYIEFLLSLAVAGYLFEYCKSLLSFS